MIVGGGGINVCGGDWASAASRLLAQMASAQKF